MRNRYKELWEDAFHDSLEMKAEISELKAENSRLKAEVERLTSDLQMEKENEDRLVRLHQDARNEVERLRIAGSESEPRFVLLSDYRHLKAEVERLTKAGDAMLSEWSNGDEKDAKNFLKALAIWHTAKGVQS